MGELEFERKTLFSMFLPNVYAEETMMKKGGIMLQHHLHTTTELYFLLEGERYYFIEQDTFHVKSGMAVLVNPNQIHKTSTVPGDTGHHRFLLQLDTVITDRFFALKGVHRFSEISWNVTEFSAEDWQRALNVIEQLKYEMCHETSENHTMSLLLIMELLELFVRNHSQPDVTRHLASGRTVHSGIYPIVHEIALYLKNHSSEECSLDEISSHFFISRAYLTRIFKSVTGFTVKEYLTYCRIQKAKELLNTTSLSITEIAARCGFGNITNFEINFKNMTTMTPLQYRKREAFITSRT